MDACISGSLLDGIPDRRIFLNTFLQSESNIFLQRIGKQEIFLGDIGNIPVQNGKRNLVNGGAVQHQHPLLTVVNP